MAKLSAKKKKKDKARRDKIKRRTTTEQNRRQQDDRAALFPEIIFEANGAPEGFMRPVQKAVQRVARHHEKLFPKRDVQALHFGHTEGFQALTERYDRSSEERGRPGLAQLAELIIAVGEAIFHALPPSVFTTYFPFYDLSVLPGTRRANALTLTVRTLATAKTPGGTAYFSPQRPTLETPNGQRIVGFYRHAAERICERTVINWRSYGGLGDAFAFLHDCVYYEPWHANETLGFVLYERATPNFTYQYVTGVLGEAHEKADNYYYRLGYCPAVEAGDLVVAKTLLTPGMWGTPESEWYLQSVGNGARDRKALEERAANLTRAALSESRDFSLLKQFHEGGIPQIVRLNQPVFQYK